MRSRQRSRRARSVCLAALSVLATAAAGQTDGINPTDNLTPRDLAVMLPFEDDQRLGLPAVKLDWIALPDHTLTVFATPYFEPSVIPWPKSGPTRIETRP